MSRTYWTALLLLSVGAFAAGIGGRPADALPTAAASEPDTEFVLPPDELVPGDVRMLEAVGDTQDWGLVTIDAATAWKTTKGKGAVVAVLDTGIDANHRDFKGQIKAVKDFTNSTSGSADVNGHGSFCAGTVAAAENGVGMVGVAPEAQLVIGKVLSDRGSGMGSWIAAGIDWAVANDADVISLSLGSDGIDSRIEAAIKRALAAGRIVVAAAGNSGPREGTVGYPGGQSGVVCVAAVDAKLATAGFSSRGRAVMVAAPGVNIRSAYPGDRFATMSGTSMATPYVAGCAALYVADCKRRGVKPTPTEFTKLVESTSRDLPPAGRDTATGFGLIQPAKLVVDAVVVPVPPGASDTWVIRVPEELKGRKIKQIVVEFEKP